MSQDNYYSNTDREGNKMHSRVDWFLKWILIGAIAAMVAITLTGCNTVAGIGKDLQAAARGIQAEMSDDDPYGVASR